MKVIATYRNKTDLARRPKDEHSDTLFDPLPEEPGIVFRIMRGDLVWVALGGWLKPPHPRLAVRWHDFPIALPFLAWHTAWPIIPISWRLWRRDSWRRWTGYIGAKVFQANDPRLRVGEYQYPQYLNFIPITDLLPGSRAMQPSFRPFARPE